MLPRPRGELCVTTDAVVQDVHFTLERFTPEDVGHKALAVNLSDLAAMGARPAWFVCAIAMPRDFPERTLLKIARGMSRLAGEHRIPLVGGNFTAASELSITITAAGEVEAGRAIRRDCGRPGDVLYVSGTLGEARLGLRHLKEGQRSRAARRQLRPMPRIALGRLAIRYASAGMDISDGLAQDLGHLCEASDVGAVVELARLPLGPEVARLEDAALFALQGGEDYELLLAVPPRRAAAFERACARRSERVTRVGQLTTGRGITLQSPTGEPVRVPAGFDHFRASEQTGRRHLTPGIAAE